MAPGEHRGTRRHAAAGRLASSTPPRRGAGRPAASKSESGEGRLRVAVVDGDGRPVPDGGLSRWLTRVAPASAQGIVTIALASDARVRALNRTYRGKNYATDVLSFPASAPVRTSLRTHRSRDHFLGDVVIAIGVARRQAREAGHDDRTELRILALHGVLHLLGYDHERDGGRMARVERRLRRLGGLRTGLIERARA